MLMCMASLSYHPHLEVRGWQDGLDGPFTCAWGWTRAVWSLGGFRLVLDRGSKPQLFRLNKRRAVMIKLITLFIFATLAPDASPAGATSCLRASNLPSRKAGSVLIWTAQLDSTACAAGDLPFAVRVTAHIYKDQGMTIEFPMPETFKGSPAAAPLEFLIDRSERVDITGLAGEDRKDLKTAVYFGIKTQVVGGEEGHALIKSLLEDRVTNPSFCAHYVDERFTGGFKVYRAPYSGGSVMPQEVADFSLSQCLIGKAKAMAVRAVQEQVEVPGSSRRYLNVNAACSIPVKGDNKSGICRTRGLDHAPWTVTGTVEQTISSTDGARTTPQSHPFTCSVLILNPSGGRLGRAAGDKTEGHADSAKCKVD
jgi:hypothetical protein